MNTNDLPPAAKLAALIEAGRAANPDLKHGRGWLYSTRRNEACALGFAALGDGAPRDLFDIAVAAVCWPIELRRRIAKKNDNGATLDEIILSLREGELAKVCA